MGKVKSKVKEMFLLNGIEIPIVVENGEYYLNGQKRHARKYD